MTRSGEFNAEYKAWYAFDGNNTSAWLTPADKGGWIAIEFPYFIKPTTFETLSGTGIGNAKTVEFHADSLSGPTLVSRVLQNVTSLVSTFEVPVINQRWTKKIVVNAPDYYGRYTGFYYIKIFGFARYGGVDYMNCVSLPAHTMYYVKY